MMHRYAVIRMVVQDVVDTERAKDHVDHVVSDPTCPRFTPVRLGSVLARCVLEPLRVKNAC